MPRSQFPIAFRCLLLLAAKLVSNQASSPALHKSDLTLELPTPLSKATINNRGLNPAVTSSLRTTRRSSTSTEPTLFIHRTTGTATREDHNPATRQRCSRPSPDRLLSDCPTELAATLASQRPVFPASPEGVSSPDPGTNSLRRFGCRHPPSPSPRQAGRQGCCRPPQPSS